MNRRSTVRNGRDRAYAKRLAIAFALAIALHEIAAGFLPRRGPAPPPEERIAAQTVTIVRRTPRPTPAPTAVPTPQITPAPHYTLAPQTVVRAPAPKAAARPARTTGGTAARLHVVPHRTAAARTAPRSLAEGTRSGEQGGGSGTGAGPGKGTGGLGGTGSGTGGTGNGNGGDTNGSPCGEVYLEPGSVGYRPDGTVEQQVVAKIVLRDGSVQQGLFPYPFVYPEERKNPFVYDDVLSPDKGTPVQQPPAGTDLSTAPAAVRVVLKYTNPANGRTTLPECESASPAP